MTLLFAKFKAYGLSKSSLKLLLDYLEGRKQRVKNGSSYSFWSDVKRGVPQGSTLVLLLLNVVINDLLMFIENCKICTFSVILLQYPCGGMELSSYLENVKDNMKIISKWFRINSLKGNPGKFQFMILGKKQSNK